LSDDSVIPRLIEKVESRHYGKYRGFVTDNKDPENRGRIMATVPSLLGSTQTGWCETSSPYGGSEDIGFYMIPDVGAGVWIEFEGGEISLPIWSGVWWAPGKIPKEAIGSSEPSKKIIKTKKGHIIELEDEDGKEKITIQDKTKQNLIEIDSVGNSIKIKATTIEIEASASMTLKSSGTLTIQGALVKIN
jgi:uncharacterized protein involved in type VI secretion and phage assembly